MNEIALLIAATLSAGTVLAIAGLGLLVNERAGIVNLGAEGLMLVAAIAGFATGVHTGSDVLGFIAGMAAGALLSLFFGLLVIWLNTNQYATGLALSLFGAGFSAFVGTSYTQQRLSERSEGVSSPCVGAPRTFGRPLLTGGNASFVVRTRALAGKSWGFGPTAEVANARTWPRGRVGGAGGVRDYALYEKKRAIDRKRRPRGAH